MKDGRLQNMGDSRSLHDIFSKLLACTRDAVERHVFQIVGQAKLGTTATLVDKILMIITTF